MSDYSGVVLPTKPDDYVRLPSGATVELKQPDWSKLASMEDYMELKYALQEKIIDIELQIDLFQCGIGVEQGRSYQRDWLPRANAALKWTKLYRDECQNRAGMFKNAIKAARGSQQDAMIVEAARDLLDSKTFHSILVKAGIVEDND